MPELPEVQTTVNGLREHTIGLKIVDVWTNYNSKYFKGSDTIKDPAYFRHFKKQIMGQKITKVERRAKNILISLSNDKTVLIHMKMTGHLLFGRYNFIQKNKSDPWSPIEPEGLKDPFNKRVRFVITFNNGKHLALSDTRKFAKVTLIENDQIHLSQHLKDLGPEPLHDSFTFEIFSKIINRKPDQKIKLALMDQTMIAGIGNIYADESLFRAGLHPATAVINIQKKKLQALFSAIKTTLSKGIALGGDSMSDYRNLMGTKGNFQEEHCAYQRTGEKCSKKGCAGTIRRIVIGGRATHFCDRHQSSSNV
jgi:formamidopyrimidine-DNA glycosylase